MSEIADLLVHVPGDLNQLFAEIKRLASHDDWPVGRNRSRRAAQIEDWADGIEPLAGAYCLSLFAMHLGLRDLSLNMANVIVNSPESGNDYLAKAHNIIGINYKRSDPQRALKHYNVAMNHARRISNQKPVMCGNILGNIGSLLYEIGRFDKAIACYRESNVWARRARNKDLLAQNRDDIACAYRAKGDYATAISHHKKCARDRRKAGDLICLSLSLNNLGECYADLERYDEAIACFEESLNIKKNETSHTSALVRGYLNLGEALIQKGLLRKALGNIVLGLRKTALFTDHVAHARMYFDVAYICVKAGHREPARLFLAHANELASRIPSWRSDPSRMKWISQIQKEFIAR